MPSLASNLKGSQVFKLQDEHNASYFQNVVDWITPNRFTAWHNQESDHKVTKLF